MINDFKWIHLHVILYGACVRGIVSSNIPPKDFRYRTNPFKVCSLPVIAKYIRFGVKTVFYNVN